MPEISALCSGTAESIIHHIHTQYITEPLSYQHIHGSSIVVDPRGFLRYRRSTTRMPPLPTPISEAGGIPASSISSPRRLVRVQLKQFQHVRMVQRLHVRDPVARLVNEPEHPQIFG